MLSHQHIMDFRCPSYHSQLITCSVRTYIYYTFTNITHTHPFNPDSLTIYFHRLLSRRFFFPVLSIIYHKNKRFHCFPILWFYIHSLLHKHTHTHIIFHPSSPSCGITSCPFLRNNQYTYTHQQQQFNKSSNHIITSYQQFNIVNQATISHL